jgi:uncharacterized protein (TIGR02996 family)
VQAQSAHSGSPNRGDAFLQAIIERPDEDADRLIYADWLDENGDPTRAEFIRLQCALAEMKEDDPRRQELLQREEELLSSYGKQWAGPISALVDECKFCRGFVGEVTIPANALLRNADSLFRSAPIRSLWVIRAAPDNIDHLANLPHLARLRELNFSSSRIGAPVLVC